ncbi:UDP binding domain-containing protein, partial [Methanoculleus bourgensis]|uniref:UDP binding domain-containing protein n=1 Tax=Methanoculleus bourgensis TaxID=83986 RepID=UPI003B9371DF
LGGDLDWPEGRESLYTLARGINDFMPAHMVHLTESALAQVGKSLNGSRIALLGWAFINDSDDARNTPAEPFYEMAKAAGAEVAVHDPWVDPVLSPDAPPGLSRDLEGVLAGADAVVVFAGHKEYRGLAPVRVRELSGSAHPAVLDGRNVVDPDAWIAAGFVYRGIGRGDRN